VAGIWFVPVPDVFLFPVFSIDASGALRVDFPHATREHFVMLFESAHIRVTGEYGAGTLWLGFTGPPVNALGARRLIELDSALVAIESNPFLNVLVVRSAKPAGFFGGLHPSAANVADRAAFAGRGTVLKFKS
jgi:hypothetical protein